MAEKSMYRKMKDGGITKGAYSQYHARTLGFKNTNEYRQACVQKLGFRDYNDYLNKLAQKKGFVNYYFYTQHKLAQAKAAEVKITEIPIPEIKIPEPILEPKMKRKEEKRKIREEKHKKNIEFGERVMEKSNKNIKKIEIPNVDKYAMIASSPCIGCLEQCMPETCIDLTNFVMGKL